MNKDDFVAWFTVPFCIMGVFGQVDLNVQKGSQFAFGISRADAKTNHKKSMVSLLHIFYGNLKTMQSKN
ncbi:hypothetical protein KIN20_000535 [Parelaphostrongylus tenuis]|uniref:Uncharacterized protein n=1 Tax=Parelaphostrongylus tenuis TaxID=148309 RepID=A0AAD5LSC0_PARTN|nr:hypothetical protein KIN20_000535 [Parelaphostrongylus tenuis]